MQKSFAKCFQCSLNKSDGLIYHTDSKEDILNIDHFLVIDFFDYNLIETHLSKNYKRYLLMKPVICDAEYESNEYVSALDICRENVLKTIELLKPKKIIAVGQYSKSLVNADISFDNLELFLDTTKTKKIEKGDNSMILVDPTSVAPLATISKDPTKPYMFTIPDKYYTTDYRLVDVQHISKQSRIIYIFRDKDNKKEFYEFPIKQNDFYWYESLTNENKIIETYDHLQLKVGNHKERCLDSRGYGADYNLTTVHSVDYFMQSKGEAPVVKRNLLFFDIEVYMYKEKIFPDPKIAAFPINAISFTSEDPSDPIHIFLLKIDNEIDPKIDEYIREKKIEHVTVFTDEYSLITAFCNRVTALDLDYVAGWNSNHFDFPYLFARMKKLQISPNLFSPFGNIYADTTGRVIMSGMVALDQLDLFKNDTTRPTQTSYKLDSIAESVTGKRKVQYEGRLEDLYRTDILKFILYSSTDAMLLKSIEESVRHIALQDEIRIITTTSHSGASSTIGQAEGLFITSMKKKGMVARNKEKHEVKEELPGAYVFEAKGGLKEGIIIDFDFQSLYPSIINSWNLGPDTLIAKFTNPDDSFRYLYDRDSLKNSKIPMILDPIHSSVSAEMSLQQLEDFIKENEATVNISGTIFIGHHKKESIFYTVVDSIFKGRKYYKKLMLEAKEKGDKIQSQIYNGKQQAWKILANSLYGVLANEHFTFYSIDLAKSITLTGQELLKFSAVHMDHFLKMGGSLNSFEVNPAFQKDVENLQICYYGDTDSIFVYLTDYLKSKGLPTQKCPEVLEEINKIQQFINVVVLDTFGKIHNVPKDKSMIFLKNEYIFKKFYSLNGKKHYAAKMIAQEGRDITGMEVKGLETRRSEIPPYSRALLNKILDMILDDDPTKRAKIESEVIPAAIKEATELIRKRDPSVARTINFAKPISEYKNVPQHLKGMLMWNEIMGTQDFRPGTKGKLWEIAGIDIDKAPKDVQKNYYDRYMKKFQPSDLSCICVPEDDKLPPYFILNETNMIEYAVRDRCNNLMEPLLKKDEQLNLQW